MIYIDITDIIHYNYLKLMKDAYWIFWIVFLIVIFRFNDLQFGCSDIEQMVSKHEQMAQDDAAKTMMFLRENFSNNSLCIFRNNSAWLN